MSDIEGKRRRRRKKRFKNADGKHCAARGEKRCKPRLVRAHRESWALNAKGWSNALRRIKRLQARGVWWWWFFLLLLLLFFVLTDKVLAPLFQRFNPQSKTREGRRSREMGWGREEGSGGATPQSRNRGDQS